MAAMPRTETASARRVGIPSFGFWVPNRKTMLFAFRWVVLVECFAQILPARRATDCSQLRGRRRAGSGYPGGFLNPCANLENRATNEAARSGDAGHAVTLGVLFRDV